MWKVTLKSTLHMMHLHMSKKILFSYLGKDHCFLFQLTLLTCTGPLWSYCLEKDMVYSTHIKYTDLHWVLVWKCLTVNSVTTPSHTHTLFTVHTWSSKGNYSRTMFTMVPQIWPHYFSGRGRWLFCRYAQVAYQERGCSRRSTTVVSWQVCSSWYIHLIPMSSLTAH